MDVGDNPALCCPDSNFELFPHTAGNNRGNFYHSPKQKFIKSKHTDRETYRKNFINSCLQRVRRDREATFEKLRWQFNKDCDSYAREIVTSTMDISENNIDDEVDIDFYLKVQLLNNYIECSYIISNSPLRLWNK